MKKVMRFIFDPTMRFNYLVRMGFYNHIDDEVFLKKKYHVNFKRNLNLVNPNTFNEKLNWLKLNDRKDIYTKMADKYEAKKFVEKKVGKKYVIPLIGVYDNFDDIDFVSLPNRFVIKTTHDSSGPIICMDKSKLNIKKAREKINMSLRRNYYYSCREWPYKNIKPRIIIENFVEDDFTKDLRDYKFLCFNGEPKYVYITVKNDDIFENYYDMNFKPVKINHGFPRSRIEFKKPELFDEMKEVARRLSKDTPFLRVDLHYAGGRVLFGEMTFYDWAGFRPFVDDKWDKRLGDLLDLGLIKNEV